MIKEISDRIGGYGYCRKMDIKTMELIGFEVKFEAKDLNRPDHYKPKYILARKIFLIKDYNSKEKCETDAKKFNENLPLR